MEWVSSLTYPHKADGSLHICLNPHDLNKAIIWEHYKAPTLDEITHKLSGAKVFSKLDVKDGFWSIHLDTRSSFLTTFNTHKGHYQFLHVPFGLKMPRMSFKCGWTKSLIGSLASLPYMTTSVSMAKTLQNMKTILLKLLQTAQDHGLVFNSNKCSIHQPQISLYGAIFISQGMKPDPVKVHALQDLPAPHTPKQLQSF